MALTRRRLLEIGALVSTSTVLAGCQGDGGGDGGNGSDGGDDGGGDGSNAEVAMVDSQFDPRNLDVATGTTVVWRNEDANGHTVTSASDNWSFDQEVAAGGTTSHTFDESGVFDVFCRFHGGSDLSGMSMKVAVGGATIQSPLGSNTGSDGESGSDGGGDSGDGGGASGPY